MKVIFTLAVFFSALQLQSLDFNEVSSEVNLDTLVKRVRILSSEDSVEIDNTKYLLDRSTPIGRDLTVEYIEKYVSENFPNLEVVKQNYSSGTNITIIQKGKVYPDSYYIYAGHYDAVTKYCADDNATGVAAILETMRILSQLDFEYSIVYGFWDEEEKGLIGSFNYAQMAASNNKQIMGVLNIDMIGYDGNGDNLFDIHELQQITSLALSDTLQTALNRSFLNLNAYIFEEGTNRSDHAAFWLYGYPAIMFGEAFLSGDENPAYHTVNDRIDLIDLSYFHDLAQLGASTIARLAVPVEGTNVNTISDIELSLYPNPADDFIRVDARKSFTFNLYDMKGTLILSKQVAESDFIIDISNINSGVYIAKITSGNSSENRKLIIR